MGVKIRRQYLTKLLLTRFSNPRLTKSFTNDIVPERNKSKNVSTQIRLEDSAVGIYLQQWFILQFASVSNILSFSFAHCWSAICFVLLCLARRPALENSTCNRRQARENMCEQGTIGLNFCFLLVEKLARNFLTNHRGT